MPRKRPSVRAWIIDWTCANGRPVSFATRADCDAAFSGEMCGSSPEADAVTASASGLDPHISPENAASQSARVANETGLPLAQVQSMIQARTEGRFLGIYGEPRVNVLLLNLDIDKAAPKK